MKAYGTTSPSSPAAGSGPPMMWPRSSPWVPTGFAWGPTIMVALECLRCHNCESGRGCARGIATTDPELTNLMTQDWGTQRIINVYTAWRKQLRSILKRLGLTRISDLVGRWDVVRHLDYIKGEEFEGELE